MNIATFTIQVFGPEDDDVEPGADSNGRLLANLPAIMESVEEDLTDLLPEGYRAIVKEWDK